MRDQRLWTWHLGAGAVILVLLGLHMTVMHLLGGEPTAWASVVARGKSLFFLVSNVLLLGTALFHGFYGLRNIVFELNPATGVKKAVNGLLVTAGLILFAVGTWAAWSAFAAARTLPVA